MFEVFGFLVCFIAGSGLTILFVLLARNDGESTLPPDEAFDRAVLKQWKLIGLVGGLLGAAYYNITPRDPGLQAILSMIWQAAGGNPV
jgi:hypothetical protein